MEEIKQLIQDYRNELINLRRDFHMYPELGFEEYRTQGVIERYLQDLGLEVSRVADTGVVGLLRGANPGPTLLMRADMDALPMTEENEAFYRSQNEGKMHSCAHDGHMAMLLIAAKILAQYQQQLNGNIKFVFQPDEEGAGAKWMVQEGVLEAPKVDACVGLHLWTPLETGQISVTPGPVMAAHDNFKITVIGKGGHTASPQTSIDPVMVASQIIQNAQAIQTRQINILKPTLIMFAQMQAGTAPNIIPEEAHLEGTIRYLYEGGPDSEERPRERFEELISGICKTFGADYNLEFIPSNFSVVNEPLLTDMIGRVAEEVVGKENLVHHVSMAGEDFSEFGVNVPSTFYFIGTKNEEKGSNYPHHHPRFDIDEDSLPIGVEMHVKSALRYLIAEEGISLDYRHQAF